ncbi:MAG: AraC-like DNA-binding protein [Glaciecola sp.]|jgi:AraC-like DNA-binding protein
MGEIYHIKSITEAHQLLGLESPKHPLISIFRHTKQMNTDFNDMKLSSNLFYIALKDKISGGFKYGRNTYDFQEGTLIFVAPNQILTPEETLVLDFEGWSILFHPDLIRNSELGNAINNYSFFNYDVMEALHLSNTEKQGLTDCVNKIENEINQNMDKHSQELIIHNLESILKYSSRFYDRQFYTRANLSKDYLSKFEAFIKAYFDNNNQLEKGIPTVKQCGIEMNMSGHYLSDLLKNETGKSLIEHLHLQLIDRAKNSLLSTNDSVSQIAYSLGFGYPQYFSKLFKSKTGMSPSKYRNLN